MTAPVQRHKFRLAYDGTAYAGWQLQPNALTVQEVVEKAIATVVGERPRLHGSGRTDQGVHARCQVAHADLPRERSIPPRRLLTSLNAILPPDVRVLGVTRCAPDFHARRSAVAKEYRYHIWNGDVVPPFLRLYRTQVRNPLDVAAMRAAAQLLVGRHDFAAFSANPNREVESTVRDVTQLRVTRRGPDIAIIARGEGFLYKMVRSLAGFLIRVGEGSVPPEDARRILESRTRTAHVPTAPAAGLFLWNVWY